MLTIKNANKEDMIHIHNLLSNHLSEDIHVDNMIKNTMIAYDGSIPLAAAAYEPFGSVALLRYVVVSENHQREYLGDGILKALLNLAEKRGVRLMIVDASHCIDFFTKVGFMILDEDSRNDETVKQVVHQHIDTTGTIYAAKLPEFFLKACRSNKK